MFRETRRGLPALAPVAAAMALGALVARALPRATTGRAALQLAAPLPVVDAWGAAGARAFWVLAAAVLAATVALALAALARPAVRRPAIGAIVAGAALALAADLAWPFVFSSDVYAYAAYGALARAGIDPYLRIAPAVHGPAVDAARFQWGGGTFPPCVYGPAFVALARGLVTWLEPLGPAAPLFGFRLLGAGAFLASVPALAWLVRDLALGRRRLVVAAYALDPAALWGAAEGHNDAVLGCLALLGAAAGLRARSRSVACAGIVLVGLTPAFKATGLAFAVGLAVALVARRDRPGLAVLAGAVAVALAWAIPPVLPALAALRSDGRYAPAASLSSLVGLGPTLALAAATFALAGRAALRCDRRGYAWLGLGAWLALPNPYPWYALWALPAAAVAAGGPASVALWGATIFAVVRYLPDAAGGLDPTLLRLAALAASAPLVIAVGALLPRRPPQKATPAS